MSKNSSVKCDRCGAVEALPSLVESIPRPWFEINATRNGAMLHNIQMCAACFPAIKQMFPSIAAEIDHFISVTELVAKESTP